MPATVHGAWSFPIFLTLVLMAASLVYWWNWRQVRLPVWRLLTFLGGIFSIWAAVGSPLANLDHRMLTFHMVQHLVLMTVAAPLILMGGPAVRIVVHPAVCWLVSTSTVIAWHVPALFDIAMRSEPWHEVEQVSFLVAGLL